MDEGRYHDLRQLTDKIKTMPISSPARHRYERNKAAILKQLKHPELQEMRRKAMWAGDTGRVELREACEKRMRAIQEYEL